MGHGVESRRLHRMGAEIVREPWEGMSRVGLRIAASAELGFGAQEPNEWLSRWCSGVRSLDSEGLMFQEAQPLTRREAEA